MSEENIIELNKYMMIANTVRIIGWIVLAICFNKWWISLFSALFLGSVECENKEE